MIKKLGVFIGIATILSACSTPAERPINLTGSFRVRMNLSAEYDKNVKQYPVSATLIDNVPYFYNQVIPAGSGLIGTYSNNGFFKCSIVWTAIILPDNTPISSAKGVAISGCHSRAEIAESQIITAKWN